MRFENMRLSPIVITVLLVAGLSAPSVGLAAGASGATALDGTAILPDPSLASAHVLPASAATAGVAAVSAAADGPLKDCSSRNPCAMATPARDHVAVEPAHAPVAPQPKARHLPAGTADLRS
jgi:hypothetical protein